MEERCARDAEAAGSNPASPIKKEKEEMMVSQMVHDL